MSDERVKPDDLASDPPGWVWVLLAVEERTPPIVEEVNRPVLISLGSPDVAGRLPLEVARLVELLFPIRELRPRSESGSTSLDEGGTTSSEFRCLE